MPATFQAETLFIEGADAIAFAQAQFSGNAADLAVGRWQFSAWLDAQGRVRALFQLARVSEHSLLLMLRGGRVEPLADALRRFVFRSKLTLQALPVRALGTSAAMESHTVEQRGDVVVLGCGTHSMTIGAREDDAWRAEQIHLGWPWLPDSALDSLLPPALSLERLQAVAFDKGCYPGQEIAARLHFRGGHKRHMHCVVLSQALPPGSVLRDAQSDVAVVLDNVLTNDAHSALAIINDALAEQAKSHALRWNEDIIDIELRERWPA
ncbi:CAF17-like 4Fe-4S cluster assembly/insertion protein YgfZ [Dyella sp. 2RAB6]|uniref:CAF17-like 4Fe-4S cluster assembly/insertion protein YgfZ n=1 Tax=Dyella sp. 2RAB6 TaxID=3232992 RepID=UPI003F91C56A